jgi:hypothetical protein
MMPPTMMQSWDSQCRRGLPASSAAAGDRPHPGRFIIHAAADTGRGLAGQTRPDPPQATRRGQAQGKPPSRSARRRFGLDFFRVAFAAVGASVDWPWTAVASLPATHSTSRVPTSPSSLDKSSCSQLPVAQHLPPGTCRALN